MSAANTSPATAQGSSDHTSMSQIKSDAQRYVNEMGHAAVVASKQLLSATTERKNTALRHAAKTLRESKEEILQANHADLRRAEQAGRDAAYLDRLMLDEGRIDAIAAAVETVAELPDPVGRILMRESPPNGLDIQRVATPLGVIGMIFEARPNVAADASALCVKSGNAVILRAGSDSRATARVIVRCMRAGLEQADLPVNCVQFIDTEDRAAVTALLRCTESVDLVIPRGGRGLVSLVDQEARVPTLLHLDGNCHTYIHRSADFQTATAVLRNAKLRRTGICGATESLVIDREIGAELLPQLIDAMPECSFLGDEQSQAWDSRVQPATESDWGREYLSATMSVKAVDDLEEAISFVGNHSSGHTDAILTDDHRAAEAFLNRIDSAVVMHNASTQFSDGGEFGMGAEIGIATGKVHARGPVGLEQLTTFKYIVRGNGQTRS